MRIDRLLAGALVALTAAAAGCGGGSSRTAPTTLGPQVDGSDLAVVRHWADTLRRGDVDAAARYFAIPSHVSNGGPTTDLQSVAEVRFFNATLPCGARVTGAEPSAHDFFIVTFVLTERPGAGTCGAGAGATARTAFRVSAGHITDWLRIEDQPSAPSAQV